MTSFRHKCDEQGCWLHRRWDPGRLGEAAAEADGIPQSRVFPRGSSPGDMDGWMDCRGYLLFIETKEAGAPISRGQEWGLENITLLSPRATVLLQECAPPHQDAVTRIRFCTGGKWDDWLEVDRLGRDRHVQDWFKWAETDSVPVAA